MYDISKKHYIIKLSTGRIINIFYKEKAGILLSLLNKRNQWSEPVILMKGAHPNFSACVDSSDNIHLLCQDMHGNIVHMYSSDNDWDMEIIIKSKSPSSYDKFLQICFYEGKLIFLFVVEYMGRKILSYQIKDKNNITEPKVIDYVPSSGKPYHLVLGLNNSLYIVYKFIGNKNNQIGYKSFIKESNRWGEFTPVTQFDGDSQLLSASADISGSLHILWQKNAFKKYELVYSKYQFPSNNQNIDKTLFLDEYSFDNSSVILLEEYVIVYWVKETNIFYCISEDGGNYWSKPSIYQLPGSRALYCMVYKSMLENELISSYVNELPGNYSGGYRLAFAGDYIFKQKIVTAEDFRFKLAGTLDLLSNSLDDLKSEVTDLESWRNRMVTEIDKLNIKYEITNSELSKLKREFEVIKKLFKE
jgi:hypothetical protein